MRGDGRVYLPKGQKTWQCEYWVRGECINESTQETDEGKAKQFLKRRRNEKGADEIGARKFITPKQEKTTVGELLDDLIEDYKVRGKFSNEVASHFKAARTAFGECRAVFLTAAIIRRQITGWQGEGYKDSTVNRRTQLVGQAFALAIADHILNTAPPIPHLSEKGNTREGFLTEYDLEDVLAHFPQVYIDFTLFGYKAGWRKSEISTLEFDAVDYPLVRLSGKHSKNKKPRQTAIDDEMAELLERRRQARAYTNAAGTTVLCNLIFHDNGKPLGDFRAVWYRACVAAGKGKFICRQCKGDVSGTHCESCSYRCRRCQKPMEHTRPCKSPKANGKPGELCGGEAERPKYVGKTFHDLRRSAVRNMKRAGIDDRMIMALIGHSGLSMVERYDIRDEEDYKGAATKVIAYRKTKKRPLQFGGKDGKK